MLQGEEMEKINRQTFKGNATTLFVFLGTYVMLYCATPKHEGLKGRDSRVVSLTQLATLADAS